MIKLSQPKYLSRIFKQVSGMTFNKYRLKIKKQHRARRSPDATTTRHSELLRFAQD